MNWVTGRIERKPAIQTPAIEEKCFEGCEGPFEESRRLRHSSARFELEDTFEIRRRAGARR